MLVALPVCLTRLTPVIWNEIKVLNNPLWLGYPVWLALSQKIPSILHTEAQVPGQVSRVLPTSQQNSTAGVQSNTTFTTQQWRSSNP